jgi:hypothetical protein
MAKLSNSSIEKFLWCPQAFENRYVDGLVPDRPEPDYLTFGTYFHSLLQAHYTGGAAGGPPTGMSLPLVAECEAMFEAYKAAYPIEPFEVIECEKQFELNIGKHALIGRIDMMIRDKASKKLQLLETKTEKHGSKRNLPQAWVARHQGSLYVWAATNLFGMEVDTVLLNIATRGTVKGQVGPAFRRESLHRTPVQLAEALRTFEWVADNVDRRVFIQTTNGTCINERGYACEYYNLCHLNDSSGLVQLENPYAYLTQH